MKKTFSCISSVVICITIAFAGISGANASEYTAKDSFYLAELERGVIKEYPLSKKTGGTKTNGNNVWRPTTTTENTPTSKVESVGDYIRITDMKPNSNNKIIAVYVDDSVVDFSDCESHSLVLRVTARQSGIVTPKYRIDVWAGGQDIYINEPELNNQWQTFEAKRAAGELSDTFNRVTVYISAVDGETYDNAVLEIADITIGRCTGVDTATFEVDEDVVIRNIGDNFWGYSMDFQNDTLHRMELASNNSKEFADLTSRINTLRNSFETKALRIGGAGMNSTLWKCELGPYEERLPYRECWFDILDEANSPKHANHMGLTEQIKLADGMSDDDTELILVLNMIDVIPKSVRDTLTYSKDMSSYKYEPVYEEGSDIFGNPKKQLFIPDLIIERTEINQEPEDASTLLWMDRTWDTWANHQQTIATAKESNPDTTHPYWIGTYGEIDEEALAVSLNDAKDLVRFLTLEPDDEKACDANGFNWAQYRVNLGITEPVNVTHWELGNEFAWYPIRHTDYLRLCKEYIFAIREIDPEAKFIAQSNNVESLTGTELAMTWTQSVLNDTELVHLLDGIVVHKYYDYDRMNIENIKSLEKELKLIESKGLRVWMTETGQNTFEGGRFSGAHKLGSAVSYAAWCNKLCKYPSIMQIDKHTEPVFSFYNWNDKKIALKPLHYILREYTKYAKGDVYQTYNTDDYTLLSQLSSAAFKTPWGMRLFISNMTGNKAFELGNDTDVKKVNIITDHSYSVSAYRSFGRRDDEETTDFDDETRIYENPIPIEEFDYSLSANEVLVLDLVRSDLGFNLSDGSFVIRGLAPVSSESVELCFKGQDGTTIKTNTAYVDSSSVFEFNVPLENTGNFPQGSYKAEITDASGNVIWSFNLTKTDGRYFVAEERRDKLIVSEITVDDYNNSKGLSMVNLSKKKIEKLQKQCLLQNV